MNLLIIFFNLSKRAKKMMHKKFSRVKPLSQTEIVLLEPSPVQDGIMIFASIFGIVFLLGPFYNSSLIVSTNSTGLILKLAPILNIILASILSILIIMICLLIIYFSKNIILRNEIMITNSEVLIYYKILFITVHQITFNKNEVVISIYYKEEKISEFLENVEYNYELTISHQNFILGIRQIRKNITTLDKIYFQILSQSGIQFDEFLKNLLDFKT